MASLLLVLALLLLATPVHVHATLADVLAEDDTALLARMYSGQETAHPLATATFAKELNATALAVRDRELLRIARKFFATFKDKRIVPGELQKYRDLVGKKQEIDQSPDDNGFQVVQIISNVPHIGVLNSKHQQRYCSLYKLLEKLTRVHKFTKDVEFLVQTHDAGVYPAKPPMEPILGLIRAFGDEEKGGQIPFPVGNYRGYPTGCGTTVIGFDDYVSTVLLRRQGLLPWGQKIPKAVYRGTSNSPVKKVWKVGNAFKVRAANWTEQTRNKLYLLAKPHPNLFDVGFHRFDDPIPDDPNFPTEPAAFLSLADQQDYKYIINVGNSFDWAERLRVQLFASSATIHQVVLAQEYFTPLLQPYVHFIPIANELDDVAEKVQWAVDHDDEVRAIVDNALQFGKTYLSEDAMLTYAYLAIELYAEMLEYKPVPPPSPPHRDKAVRIICEGPVTGWEEVFARNYGDMADGKVGLPEGTTVWIDAKQDAMEVYGSRHLGPFSVVGMDHRGNYILRDAKGRRLGRKYPYSMLTTSKPLRFYSISNESV